MKKERHFYLVVSLVLVILLLTLVSAAPFFHTYRITLNLTEDQAFTYNFTSNVTNIDNETLVFSIRNITSANFPGNSQSFFTWFSLNSNTGILTLNASNDSQSGLHNISIEVLNNATTPSGQTEVFYFNITPINDAPGFQNLINKTMNMTQLFDWRVNVTDEENNFPYNLNITFLSCNVAQWSTRNCSNETGVQLFTSQDYTFNSTSGALNITFTPGRNDVGSYIILFNVTDSGNTTAPYNASSSKLVNYTVEVINSKPYFRYVCDNERQATENTEFTCYINATDIDETNNLTIFSNASGAFSSITNSWFTFNSTVLSNIKVTSVNISTEFNATWFVNFTASDVNVGNWSINLTMNDTGNPTQSNSTVFYFVVNNVQDSVFLDDIPEITAYTSNNYTLYLNATDDDLLIPDETIYNEVLTFRSNNSFVSISSYLNISNKTVSVITFNPNSFESGIHSINLNVTDAFGNSDFAIFNITIVNNTPPVWNESTQVNFSLMEGNEFYLNLTANISDAENNTISFTYTNDSAFPNFTINNAGIINFTPKDSDVGRHHVVVNASDGISYSALSFTFVVYNLNESPIILRPFTVDYNATVNSSNGNINFTEDSSARFTMNIQDEDFRILSGQKSYYNESLSINVSLQGPNPNLFNFTVSVYPADNPSFPNMTIFVSSFTPNKSDVGSYNLTVNVSDLSGLSDALSINLTIQDINHDPSIHNISNQTSLINSTWVLDINATDIEDGSDNGNLTYIIEFIGSTDFITTNWTLFNNQTGLINVTFNDSQSGQYTLNVTVKDSTLKQISRVFYLKVYDFPVFLSPDSGDLINATEQVPMNISFILNHSVGDSLNLSFFINDTLRHSIIDIVNGSIINWSFTSTFSDETYDSTNVLMLYVFNSIYPQLNSSINFTMNVSHTNAPVSFNGTISNYQKNYDQTVVLNLSKYFLDVDSNDTYYNQTLGIIVSSNRSSNSTITRAITNGSIANDSLFVIFSASGEAFESFNITVNDSEYQNVSNSFTVQFTTPTIVPQQASSGSGGGGSSQVKPISLNIIVPGQITSRKHDRLIVPVSLINTGQIKLDGLFLQNIVAKNGILREDLIASFDRSSFQSLLPGQSENLTLIVDVDTREPGLYEITLNANSTSPKYGDNAKLYVNVEEGDTITEKLSFTEEFIAQNPQCVEIKEIIDEARELYIAGKLEQATDKADEALDACKKAISQTARAQVREKIYQKIIDNIGVSSIIAVCLGLGYYWFRRFRLQTETLNIDGKV